MNTEDVFPTVVDLVCVQYVLQTCLLFEVMIKRLIMLEQRTVLLDEREMDMTHGQFLFMRVCVCVLVDVCRCTQACR